MTTQFFRNQLKMALINGAIALGIVLSTTAYKYVKTYYAMKEHQQMLQEQRQEYEERLEELRSQQGQGNYKW